MCCIMKDISSTLSLCTAFLNLFSLKSFLENLQSFQDNIYFLSPHYAFAMKYYGKKMSAKIVLLSSSDIKVFILNGIILMTFVVRHCVEYVTMINVYVLLIQKFSEQSVQNTHRGTLERLNKLVNSSTLSAYACWLWHASTFHNFRNLYDIRSWKT